MEEKSLARKSSRPNQDGDSNSEGNFRRNAHPITKPAQDGDGGDGNVNEVLSSSDILDENIRRPRKYKKRRTKCKVGQTKTKKIEGTSTTCQPNYEPEPMVEIQKPPKIDTPESENEIGQPRCKKSERIPSISTEIPVPAVLEEKKWIRLKRAVKSTLTRQFDRLSSHFILNFPPRPPQTQSEPEIVPENENNPPKIVLKTNAPEPRVVSAVAVPVSVPAVRIEPDPPKKFSILDLRKSRAERGVKSLNIKMGFGFVLRKEPIRKNPKGIFGNTGRNHAKPAIPEIPNEIEQYRQQPLPKSEPMTLTSTQTQPYVPRMTFDRKNHIFTSSSFSEYGNRLPLKPIGNGDRETISTSRFDDKTEFPTSQFYPKTPFTAQFAHLLPISRY